VILHPIEELRHTVGDRAWRDSTWRLLEEGYQAGPTPMHRYVVFHGAAEIARAEHVVMETAARECLALLRASTAP
jgi:hypothetical protein